MKRRGNCYVTCEALYHLLGGTKANLVPMRVRHEGDIHWYLEMRDLSNPHGARVVIDPTAKQFKTKPPYHKGKGGGFLTKQPSKRARVLMDTLLWQG